MEFLEHLSLHDPPVQDLALRDLLGDGEIDFGPPLVVPGADVKTVNTVDKRTSSPATAISGQATLTRVLGNAAENLETVTS